MPTSPFFPHNFPVSGLVFLVMPLYNQCDLVSWNAGSLLAAGSWDANGLTSGNTTTGGGYWTPDSSFYTITSAFTIVVRANIAALSSSCKLVCVPYQASGWTSPYAAISFGRNSTNSRMSLQIGSSGTLYSCNAANNTIAAGEGTINYGVSRNGATVTFYRNGVATGNNISNSITANTNPTFTNQRQVTVLNHAPDAPGEGTQGWVSHVGIWNYALSASEMAAVHTAFG